MNWAGLMDSSIKVIMMVLGSLNLIMYWHGLRNRKDVKKVLMQATVEIEDEQIEFSNIVQQARFFLFLVLMVNECLWFLCFKYLSAWLGGIGAVLSFTDFIYNNEILGHLGGQAYSENGAQRILIGFYLLAIPYILCLIYLLVSLYHA